MPDFNYDDLRKKYDSFQLPVVAVYLGGKDISADKNEFAISDINVENTCGYEASIATFCIYNSYNVLGSNYTYTELTKYIALGTSVVIYLGYDNQAMEVFRGFVARVNFFYHEMQMPGVEITAMDVKGIMMSGSYVKQLSAEYYSDAVEEILKRTNYERMKGGQGGPQDNTTIITKVAVADTPDKSAGGESTGDKKVTDKTIEMVSESDYEFIVKAGKKFNYEFYTVGGIVYFNKAKSNTDILMELGPETGMRNMDFELDLTGLVEKVEVRGVDVGKASVISASKKLSNKISNGNKAKGFLSGVSHVVIDPTIHDKTEAQYRLDYLAEEISYRLGTLTCEVIGMPELVPGRFIQLDGIDVEKDYKVYLTSVSHRLTTERGYTCVLTGKLATLDPVN